MDGQARTQSPSASGTGSEPSGKERVKVTVRVRPMQGRNEDGRRRSIHQHNGGFDMTADLTEQYRELTQRDEMAVECHKSGKEISVYRREGPVHWHTFGFDSVLGPDSDQADVYAEAAQSVVESVLQGYNGTVMAYGQTSAGKTHTIMNMEPKSIGVIPRAAAELFIAANAEDKFHYRISMSCVQIYLETMQDLLSPENEGLALREGERGVYLNGATTVDLQSLEHCLLLLRECEKNRKFAFTKLNAQSSRSHVVVMLTVEKKAIRRTRTPLKTSRGPYPADKKTVGKLFLVDLAGSERLKKSGSEGIRASEARSINSSLYFLGKCISARSDNPNGHVPFRDSKLTRLLQESLGGNAKTSLIINIHPSSRHAEETLSSLMFGGKAMTVQTSAIVNEHEDYEQEATSKAHEVALDAKLLMREGQLESAQAAQLKSERDLVAEKTARRKDRAEFEEKLKEMEAHWKVQSEEAHAALVEGLEESLQSALESATSLRASDEEKTSELNELKDALATALKENAALKMQSHDTEMNDAALKIQKWIRRREVRRNFLRVAKMLAAERDNAKQLARANAIDLMSSSLNLLDQARASITTYFILPQKVRTENLKLAEAARFH